MTITTLFNFESERSLARIVAIEEALRAGPMTARKLAKLLNVEKSTVCAFLRHLEVDRAHIGDWERGATRYAPVWTWGAGESVPMPKWVSHYDRKAPAAAARKTALIAGASRFKPQPARRHPMDVMLFGAAA